MSYSLLGHIVDAKSKRFICTADVSFLKNLNIRSYSNDFEHVSPTGNAKKEDYKEINDYVSAEFKDYYRKELLCDPVFKDVLQEHKNGDEYGPKYKKVICWEDFVNEHSSDLAKYAFTREEIYASLKNSGENKVDEDDKVMLFVWKHEDVEGLWYRLEDFEKARPKYVKEYDDEKARYDKIKSLKDTKEWFEMSSDARDDVLSELGYCEESLEDYEWKKDSIERIITIMEFFKEDIGYRKDTVETRHEWAYSDERDIQIFIEVC